MSMQQGIGIFSAGLLAAVCTACVSHPGAAASDDTGDGSDGSDGVGAVPSVGTITVEVPPGTLQAQVVELASSADLMAAVTGNGTAYLHIASEHTWYFKTGNYLLGIESFTQYSQRLDKWVDFGKGGTVAPMQARVVGSSPHGQGWTIPSLAPGGQWPATANSAWVIGTESGVFGMGGAPQGIPLGTVVFGSMQTYGGTLSTPYLEADESPKHDSTRIRALFAVHGDTLLGGHSAGATSARRIALDVGLANVWLYGTPNYTRQSGAYQKTETSGAHTMVAEVINNNDDPVTNVLAFPLSLVSLAWGTAKCHNYSGWDYQATSPVTVVCP